MARALAQPQTGSVAILPHLPWLAAIVSLAAAGIHFAVAPAHFDEYWLLGWFFIATAWLQATWAIALVGFGTRTSLLVEGICLNLLVVLVWVWTRTVGVPVGPGDGWTELQLDWRSESSSWPLACLSCSQPSRAIVGPASGSR